MDKGRIECIKGLSQAAERKAQLGNKINIMQQKINSFRREENAKAKT